MSQDLERPTQGSSAPSSGPQELEWPERDPRNPPSPSKPQVKPGTRLLITVRNIFRKTIARQTVTAKNPSTGQIFSPFRSGEGWVLDIFGKVSDVKLTVVGRDANGDYADEIVLLRLNSDGTADQMPGDTFFNTVVTNEGGSKPARVRIDVTMTRLKEIPLSDVTDTSGKGRNFQELK